MKIDHHLHTSRHSPDSIIDPIELIEQARAIGLDGLVITEHDHQWDAEELADLSAKAGGLRIFSGAEVSAIEGHFLVLPSLDETPAGISLDELLPIVQKHQAAIVAAHPFRWDQPFHSFIERHGPVFDALELVSSNVTRETREKTEQVLKSQPGMGRTGSSDAHQVEVVGCYYTEFPRRIETMADFVRAIRSKQGRPRFRSCDYLTSGPVGDDGE